MLCGQGLRVLPVSFLRLSCVLMLPESVRAAIHWASDTIWGPWVLPLLLLGTGLFLTIRLRFVQVDALPRGLARPGAAREGRARAAS